MSLANTIDGFPSSMSLLIPWSAVEPVAEDILGGGVKRTGDDPKDMHAVQRGLSSAAVLLRAEVGSTRMPVEQILALDQGAVVEFDDRAENGVRLFAERVPLGRAHPGLRGTRRAVKLVTPVEPGSVPAMALAAAPSSPRQGVRSALLDEPAHVDADHASGAGGDDHESSGAVSSDSQRGVMRMMGVPVRVWAELGRAELPLGNALELPLGTVLTLDQPADAPIRLFANGKHFAEGALEVSDEGCWAVRIQALS